MASKQTDRVTAVIKEVEALARRLRREIRRAARETGVTRNLERMAGMLRKQAAAGAARVEKYVHALRTELSRPAVPKRKVALRRR